MAKTEEPDNLPASDETSIQAMLGYAWHVAIDDARNGMNVLRTIHPELVEHMPEEAARQIASARDSMESAVVALHKCGRLVLGSNEYDDYLEFRTRESTKAAPNTTEGENDG